MKLTDTAIRNAKPRAKTHKMADGGGLYLEVAPAGGKWWRYKYRINGKEDRCSLGTYPDIGLADARKRHLAARALVANGINPKAHWKAEKAAGAEREANSFEVVAREWLDLREAGWTKSHHAKQRARLENHVFPLVGRKPIAEVGVSDLRPVLDRLVKADKGEQAHRVMAAVSSVFKYAVATERHDRNPAADMSAAMPPRRKRNFATITDPQQVGALLRAMDGYQGAATTAAALRLAPLVFVRPGELRGARWEEFDLDHRDGPRWVIPPARRKLAKPAKEDPMTAPHVVPLSLQAVGILRELQPLTGRGELVFPGVRDPKRSMSENTINAALRNLGYSGDTIVGHGFRHMASTLLRELGWQRDTVEAQLSHKTGGVEGIYNKAQYLPERREMMQAWADYLDALKADTSGNVVPFKRAVAA